MASYLQDAITMMRDIVYQSKSRRFVIMLNRYVWENRCPDTGAVLEGAPSPCSRIRTGLHFEDVLKITSQNIAVQAKEHPMELLSIDAAELKDGTYHVDFVFSGEGVIRLQCETISAQMQDIGAPWPAKCHPKHEILDILQDENIE
ncbi:hypothetical protein CRD36_18090 [Paremcibacter congregatus]|jgi:hypothetical protein|uniref:DUF2948 domain-containing protein n=2 Tax=Paremcibacter congregatus TaxID=2043170 RepID=A0A2G4YME4_9PROT|nr:hypothetical protein CRD36_18090 [Paremcibacter congregatus]QDE28066.1 DUF2948 family protein [Paremcibacter congregatus]|tara:strand:+ start:904 stop:1341 length:438 start_codon:yes stop_codon:yes gene_type:complete